MLYFALTNHPEMVVYCFARAWKKGDPCSNPKYIVAAPHRNVAASRQADEPLGGDQLANFCQQTILDHFEGVPLLPRAIGDLMLKNVSLRFRAHFDTNFTVDSTLAPPKASQKLSQQSKKSRDSKANFFLPHAFDRP